MGQQGLGHKVGEAEILQQVYGSRLRSRNALYLSGCCGLGISDACLLKLALSVQVATLLLM